MHTSKSFIILIVSGFIIMLTSCVYNIEEDLYPTLECDTIDMSYSNDIQPLFESNCYECHATNIMYGNVILDSYNDVLIQINNGRLIGAIKHMEGFSAMPQNSSKLLDCQIEKIESWIEAGAPDN